MLLTEIAIGQPHFQNVCGSLRASFYFHGRLSTVSLNYGCKQRFFPGWAYSIRKNVTFNIGHFELHVRAIPITAVTTLEPKQLATDEDGSMVSTNKEPGSFPELPASDRETTQSTELDDREQKRRMKISKANKGNTPWNKGRKHSPETLQRIKEKTKLAMQNPKIKRKLANLGHAQTEETRMKIGLSVRMRCELRRKRKMVQERCFVEWQNMIAEAARHGCTGEEELQWGSYKTLTVELRKEWLEIMEKEKNVARENGRRAPKTLEQRRKIAEAIAAKWTDPEYRERVRSSMEKHRNLQPGVERRPRKRPSYAQRMKKTVDEKVFNQTEVRGHEKMPVRKSKPSTYTDPLASSKLEMIKEIRAKRAASITEHLIAIQRARLLIAEADKAAKALEVAAAKNPVAHASLIETRKLISQAVQSIKSIEARQVTQVTEPAVGSDPVLNEVINAENEIQADASSESQKQSNQTQINGKSVTTSSTHIDSLKFGGFDLGEILQATRSSGYSFSISHDLNGKIKDLGQVAIGQLRQPEADARSEPSERQPSENQVEIHSQAGETETKSRKVVKKWVRGKLVVVTEEA